MRPSATLLLLIALASPALAQPADPIGDLLSRPQSTAPAQVQEAPEPETAPDPEPEPQIAPGLPAAPQPYVPRVTQPVHVNETGKTPERPPTASALAYDSRIRSSAASVQSFQGALDGEWTLVAGTTPLFTFKLVDKGRGEVEGAWLDLRRKGALEGSGFIDQIERVGGEMTLRFGNGTVAELQSSAVGWSGALTEAGRRTPVTMRRGS